MLKSKAAMTLGELAVRVRWFETLARLYDQRGMKNTANTFRAMSAEYRAEMERRPDTAE